MTGIGYGLIGCGSFGRFCLEQYRELPGLTLRAVADAVPERASELGRSSGLAACATVDELLERDDIHLVHIATPPTTHHHLALAAIAAGKHVLCEKPLAIDLGEAEEMVAAARDSGRLLAVNLVMRYDPLVSAVGKLLAEGLLGTPLRCFFENYAQDEALPVGHWFWDPRQSGGIFIEHGVHFFDLVASWFGTGRVLAAQQAVRPGAEAIVDQVRCTLRYPDEVLADFYHGFHQAARMDRQELRIVCSRGDLRLFEWLPLHCRIDVLASEAERERICSLLPGAHCEELARYRDEQRLLHNRHDRHQIDGRYLITARIADDKQDLYGRVLRDLLADQLAALSTPGHRRMVDERNGLESLRLAQQAQTLAAS